MHEGKTGNHGNHEPECNNEVKNTIVSNCREGPKKTKPILSVTLC